MSACQTGAGGWQSFQRDKSGVAGGDNTVISPAVMEGTETNSPPTILLYRYVVCTCSTYSTCSTSDFTLLKHLHRSETDKHHKT